LSFTHDESLSFFSSQGEGNQLFSSNNHPINTLLMSLFSFVFGDSELSLRMPNVLSFGLYLTACFLLFKDLTNRLLVILPVGLLVFNPILLEFFSLARGYGLSLAFMMISIYFLFRNCFHYNNLNILIKDFKYSVLFASLAMFSNLIMVNYLIAVLLVFIIQYLFFPKRNDFKLLKSSSKFWVYFTAITPLLIGVFLLLYLNKGNQLYHGEETMLKSLASLIYDSFYLTQYSNWVFEIIKYSVLSLFFLGAVSILIKKDFKSKFSLIIGLILILILGFFLEHILFGSPYPLGRTGILFIPLYGLFIYYFIIHIIKFYTIKFIFIPITILLSIPVIYNCYTNLNLKYTRTWMYETYTEDIMDVIQGLTHGSSIKSTISNEWFFEPTINYYIHLNQLNLEAANRDGIKETTSFIYLLENRSVPKGYEVLNSYPIKNPADFSNLELRLLVKTGD